MFKRNIGVAICSHERRFCNLFYVPRSSRQPPEVWEGGLANNEKIMVDFPTEALGRQREANSASGGLVIDHNGTVHTYIRRTSLPLPTTETPWKRRDRGDDTFLLRCLPSFPLHLRRRPKKIITATPTKEGWNNSTKTENYKQKFFPAWCCSRCRNEIIVSRARRGRRVFRRPGGRNTSSSEAGKKVFGHGLCMCSTATEAREKTLLHTQNGSSYPFVCGRKEGCG